MPLLQPKRWKYLKAFRGRNRGKSIKGNNLAFGEFGVRSNGNGRMTSRQIEAIRVLIRRKIFSSLQIKSNFPMSWWILILET